MSLGALPAELVTQIVRLLSSRCLAALTRTCRYLHLVANPTLYQRNISFFSDPEASQSCNQLSHSRPSLLHVGNHRPHVETSRSTKPREPCIIWAARNGRLETIKLAHEVYGASLEVRGWVRVNKDGNLQGRGTALHIAILNNQMAMIRYLLSRNVEVNTVVLDGCPHCFTHELYPLHIPMLHRDHDDKDLLAGLLISHGARSIHKRDDAIFEVIRLGRLRLLELLLERPETSPYQTGGYALGTALHEVCECPHEPLDETMALKLIDFGVPINHLSTSEGKSVLLVALEKGKYSLALLLLRRGADTTLDSCPSGSLWQNTLEIAPMAKTYKAYCDREAVIRTLMKNDQVIGELVGDDYGELFAGSVQGRGHPFTAPLSMQ